ncbi:hypothetical protein [Paenibacillus gallinarum]|uniref:Uncharacterized protein n=1 Tax=Paenibacillus gallinarum TaxID=2762232 RepID=A0ABR8T2Y4_9BACL|nr:hypothetical protein [Paenibacillus gallinarum]MBD7969975.1 hypothetical protein [Paenibacillus gallinarum]
MFSFLFTLVVAAIYTAISLIKGYEYDSKLLTIFTSAIAVAFTGAQYFLLGLDSILTAIFLVLALTLVYAYTSTVHRKQQGQVRKPLKPYQIVLAGVGSIVFITSYKLFVERTPPADVPWLQIVIRITLTLVVPLFIFRYFDNRKSHSE